MQVWQVRTIISVININWNGFLSLSNIFIPSAKKTIFWQILANSGKLWQTLFFGKLWQTLWQTLWHYLFSTKKGNILPKFAKVCQKQFLANFGKLWQTLFLANSKKSNILPKFALPPPLGNSDSLVPGPVPDFTGDSGTGSGTGEKFSSGQVLV